MIQSSVRYTDRKLHLFTDNGAVKFGGTKF